MAADRPPHVVDEVAPFTAEQWELARSRPLAVLPISAAIGDCVMCDGYILTWADAPLCPTCARLKREAEAK